MINRNKIISTGLIQHIDPRNPRCYPGGAVVKDLATGTTLGTVVNSPTIEFNSLFHTGATSYVSMAFPSTSVGDITVTFWVKFTVSSINQYPVIIGSGSAFNSLMFDFNDTDSGGSFRRVWIYWNSNGTPMTGITPTGGGANPSEFINGDWWCYSFRRSTTVSPFTDHFINGQKITSLVTRQGSQITNYIPSASPTVRLGADQLAHQDIFRGKVGSYHAYNRALSDSEILFNYEVERPYYPVYDADTKLYLAQLSSTPSEAYCRDVDSLIRRLKATGIWTQLDRLWVFATEVQQHARVSLRNPASTQITEVNTPTWTTFGYQGNGTNSYLDTNYNFTTSAVNYTQNSGSLGFYSRTNVIGATHMVDMGATNNGANGNGMFFNVRSITGTYNWSINGTATEGPTNPNSQGVFALQRTSSMVSRAYKDGYVFSTAGLTSTSLLNLNCYVCAWNQNGTTTNFSTRQISMAFIGGGSIDQAELGRILGNFAKNRGFAV